MKEYAIETRVLEKHFGHVKALDGVSIHVKRGEIYGLIGDNGAGKSTLLKLLVGHIFADKGEISLLGACNQNALQVARHHIGSLIEEGGFFPELTVQANMEYYRRIKGVPEKDAVEKVLKMVNLWERRKSKAYTLSMGLKKRLNIGIAILGEPELLILDEPINGLDPSGIIELRMLLKRLNEDYKMTIILSSHILTELQQTAMTFGFIEKGRILQEISIDDLCAKCADYLSLKVSDLPKYAALLDGCFTGESYKIFPNGEIHIFAPKEPRECYSRLAASNNIDVMAMEWHKHSLEEYFIQLKKERMMFNYMRSECYRIFHSRAFYVTLASFMGLPIFVNSLLLFMIHKDAGFPYAITSFSYSFFVSNPMWMLYAALLVSYVLYGGTRKNGILKNVVAIGISREKIFIGQCLVTTLICSMILIGSLVAYIGSAEWLLSTAGPVLWQDIVKTAMVGFLIAVSSIVLSITLMMLFNKEWTGVFIWFVVFEAVPFVCYLLGFKFAVFESIAMWMPNNFFKQTIVSMSVFEPIWQNIDGFEKCIISGLAGIVVFGMIGLWQVKKAEV